MIHELIEPKKKTVRNSPTKTFKENNNKPPCAVQSVEHSDNENKDFEGATFFPWLRNSLGLTQRNNRSGREVAGNVISDQKPFKTILRFREQNHNEFETLKENVSEDCSRNVTDKLENCNQEADGKQVLDAVQATLVDDAGLKSIPLYSWRGSDTESNGDVGITKRNDIKMVDAALDVDPTKEEDKRRFKLLRQRNKMRRRMLSEHGKNEVDALLEMKAREILDNYTGKDVHSVSSEMKQLEAKLILLSAKYHGVDSKFTQQEVRLLQEMKNQAGNEETFEKVIEHLKEINLREMLKNSEAVNPRGCGDNEDKEETMKFHGDKESVASTDDENDIKRFSEFLSKNKNAEEKRKCLEEVRNYFERKRRTRLTRRRYADEGKIQRANVPVEKKDERAQGKDVHKYQATVKEKKRSNFLEEEVVEKAVNETLQKFVDLYHFRVTPTMMGSMRKNILEAIRSDSLDGKPSGTERQDLRFWREKDVKNQQKSLNNQIPTKNQKSEKDQMAKVFLEPKKNDGQATQTKENSSENDSLKRLMDEFENFLNVLQTATSVSGLKLQNVTLEKQEDTKTGRLVYNFTRKALEFVKGEEKQEKKQRDVETQTLQPEVICRSLKIQANVAETREEFSQTDGKVFVASDAQTEEAKVRGLKELPLGDVSPGLYRMVRSKEPGRLYLYPENSEALGKNITEDSHRTCKKTSETMKTTSEKEEPENSVKCLYFRPSGNKLPENEAKEKNESVHSGCIWFWNGEKISPGSDLKAHVEDLLEEKLKKITKVGEEREDLKKSSETVEVIGGRKGETNQDKSDLLRSPSFVMEKADDRNIEGMGRNTVFCCRAETEVQKDGFLVPVPDEERMQEKQNLEINITDPIDPQPKEVKEVGTQNSQQKFLSLSITKLKPRSRSRAVTRIKNRRKANEICDAPENVFTNVKKVTDIIKFLREIKKANQQGGREDTTGDSSSNLGDSYSSLSQKNCSEYPLAMLLDMQKKEEEEEEEEGESKSFEDRKIDKIANLMSEAQKLHGADGESQEQWELIESILNKINQKERLNLWNDIREFVKTKVGRDISGEGAKEVCIEIEEDLPENEKEEGKQKVIAMGHYAKNSGDVEVEIDLTLDDLERILRHRQKKFRKKERRSKKFRSPTQGEVTKEDLLRCHKYIQMFAALEEAVLAEKSAQTFKKK